MRLPCTAFALLFILASSGIAGSSPAVEATLTLPYETVLPGVPFDMTVTLKNVSASPVSVGIFTRLVVTMPDGSDVSHPLWKGPLEPSSMGQNWVELAPGQSRQYYIDWQNNFFHDPAFSGPGVYGLTFHLAGSDYPDNYVGEIVTTTARLTRAVPHGGEDEALWNRMVATMDGRWADDNLYNSLKGPAILRDILQIHPGSGYYPYAVLLEGFLRPPKPVTKDHIAKALEAAGRFRTSPAYPHLLLRAAEVADSLGANAWWDHDDKTCFEYYALAEQYYGVAAKATNIPAVRVLAERGMMRVRADLERQKQRAAGTYGKINQ